MTGADQCLPPARALMLRTAFSVGFCLALRLALLVALLVAGGQAAQAQQGAAGQAQATADILGAQAQAWDSVASRAEAAVEAGRASNAALIALRDEVSGWRLQFQDRLGTNASRIATVRSQIDALGPAPEEGETEPPEIAARRAALAAELERLDTPRRVAEEAFRRAGGLIGEIDALLRDRQAQELLNMGPWPVNLALWPDALRDLGNTLGATYAGVQAAWANPTTWAQARNNLPLVLALMSLGLVLLARARRWSELLSGRIQRTRLWTGAGAAAFVVSLGQIVLPMLGLLAMIRAVRATDLFGPRFEVVLGALEPMGLCVFFAWWLGGRIFPKDDALPAPLALTQKRRTEGRINTVILGLVFAAQILLNRLSEFERYGAETIAVLDAPLVILAALVLVRLGWLMRRVTSGPGEAEAVGEDEAEDGAEDGAEGDAADGGPGERAFAARVTRVLGQGAILAGLLAPLLTIFGYGVAAKALIYPAALTLALLGVLALLQQLVRDLYAALRPGLAPTESLIPTLISFALTLASAIPLALIWGARPAELTDLWVRLREGLTIGGVTISPGSALMLIVVFALGYLLTRGVQTAMKTSVLPKTRIDPGGQTAIVSGLGYVGVFLAAVVAITAAGIDLSNIALVAGALSVGIGFGLQTIVSNFVSGIILLIERPVSEGDWIEVGGQMGHVRRISVRSTRIETFDRTDVIVPNADLISGTVTNYTRGNTVGRVIVTVGVAYGTDPKKVEAILQEIAEAHPMALANPAPFVYFAGFGADSLDFEIRIILRDVNWMLNVRHDLNHQIAVRFAEEGIEIPFAQRDVWLRNPEALHGARPPDEAPKEAGS